MGHETIIALMFCSQLLSMVAAKKGRVLLAYVFATLAFVLAIINF